MRILMTAIAVLALASPAAAQTATCKYFEGPLTTEDENQPPPNGSFAVFGDQTVTIHWSDGSKNACKFHFDDTMLGTVDCLGGEDEPRKGLLLFGGSTIDDMDQSSIAIMNGVFWYRDPKCHAQLNLGM